MGLYKTEVPVTSQDNAEQTRAMGEALGKVLLKVTGDPRTLANPQLQQAMAAAKNYVSGFSYRRDSTENPDNQAHYYLQVSFVDTAVNKLLRDSGMAIWGANRPTTLAWLAIEDSDGRQIQPNDPDNTLVNSIDQQFKERALPVIFPTMDLEDRSALSPVDVWGVFSDKIETASARYAAEAMLVGRLTLSNGRYNGRLSLLFRQQRQDAEVTDLDQIQLAKAAADLVGSTLASHYAVALLASSEQVAIRVEQVTSSQDYSALLNYLATLTAVKSMQVNRVKDTSVDILLTINGYRNQLVDAIALGRSLRRLPDNSPPPQSGTQPGARPTVPMLLYRWAQ
ncbi:DUF2066 domain-containing protein [Candidatus Sororendozoicomonas aggregata]|uniref:DUF2066 domain-containing protein n=1 Tax=Candidatus Sororendozoicomonas aggregata TaxID=3073239 RepID=UPI002ECFBC46